MADNRRRFRWLVALGVLGFAVWFLLDAIVQTLERAEQSAAGMMLSQVRSALVVRGAEAMLSRSEPLTALEGLDPLPLLDMGDGPTAEQDCRQLAATERGWCFNHQQRWLVYQPGQALELEGRWREPGEPFVWQVQVDYAATVKPGKINEKRATGLRLVEIDHHQISETQ